MGGLIKRVGGKGESKVPFLGDIPYLGDILFTHHSDVEREQNVVIYLTPYIVRKSDDLQKLKSMLSELEEVQERYNDFFEKALEEKTGVPAAEIASESTAPASRRIKRTSHQNNLSLLEEEG